MTRLALLTALALAGCADLPEAHRPSPTDSTFVAPDAVEAPAVEAVTPFAQPVSPTFGDVDDEEMVPFRHLVWARDADGATSTFVLKELPGGGYELVDRVEGIVVAIDGTEHRYVERERSIPLYDCELWEERSDVRGTVVDTELVDELDGERIVLTRAEDHEGEADVSQSLTLVATVGPYAFLSERTYSYACGAHGGIEARFHAVDMRDGSPVDVLAPQELIATRDVEEAAAMRAFAERWPEPDLMSDDVVQLSEVLPSWGADGLRVEYLFTAPTCYACSDDSWGSYAVGERVDAEAPPSLLAEHAAVPAPVAAFLADHPELEVGGFSLSHPLC